MFSIWGGMGGLKANGYKIAAWGWCAAEWKIGELGRVKNARQSNVKLWKMQLYQFLEKLHHANSNANKPLWHIFYHDREWYT